MHILHVGLGPLGARIARDVFDRGIGQVVQAVDMSPAIAGRPLREVIGAGEGRVLASLDEVTGWDDIDAAVVTTASSVEACADTFRAILRQGKPIVSTCEELVYPWLRHHELAVELDGLAKQHGGRLLGTGVNPGFLMDALPIVTTGVCRRVDRIHVWRVQDASSRRVPFQQKIGAGLSAQEFSDRVRRGTLRHVGLGESLHLIADALGLRIASWRESLEAVRAETPLMCALGEIKPGQARGVRQQAFAMNAAGETFISLDFVATIGQPDPHDRIRIEGEPNLDLKFAGGVHGDEATIAIALNALPSLGSSRPGLHTMATVPPVRCRSWKE